jgi:hypothetical protein
MAAEVGSLGDGGDRKTEVDMNLLGTDWDKGRPWAGRTEQDVGTEWLRRLDCTKRRSRMWSDRERAARGEGNVIPGAGGRSSLGWGDAEAKYNVKRIMVSHDPDGGEGCQSRTHVNGPPSRPP